MTSTYNVAVIVGSLRRESINRKLAEALTRLAPPSLSFTMVRLDELPMYNADLEANRPEAVHRFTAECARADAILFVTPEYNRSLPAVLKNAIDWGSKPMDKNVWRDKPVASAGTTPGTLGTSAAQLHLRQVMGALGSYYLGGEAYVGMKPGLLGADGSIEDESTRNFLKGHMERFAGFIAKLAPKKA